MEGDISDISTKSTVIIEKPYKEQLDVFVCGHCDSVFHHVREFEEHRARENGRKAVINFLRWKHSLPGSFHRDQNNDFTLYNQWCGIQDQIHINKNQRDLNIAETADANISNTKVQDTLNLSKDSIVFLKQSNVKIKSVEKPSTPSKKRLIIESPKKSPKLQIRTIDIEQPGLMSCSSDSTN